MFNSWPSEDRGARNPGKRPDQRNFTSPLLEGRHAGWQLGLPASITPQTSDIPTIIAVGGGKGGVGKSLISANLAARLAQVGRKVLVVDLDIGGANLHTYFGTDKPSRNLHDLVTAGATTFCGYVATTQIPSLYVVAGPQEDRWRAGLSENPTNFFGVWEAILSAKRELAVDIVVLDLGAGSDRYTVDFFTAAHLGAMVVLPEPTSIENAYLFLKASLWQLISHTAARLGLQESGQELLERVGIKTAGGAARPQSYVDRLRHLAPVYPGLVDQVFQALRGRTIGLIMNQTRSQRDADIGKSMQIICQNYFGFSTQNLGFLNNDDTAWKSLRNRRLLIVDFPHSLLTRRISELAATAVTSLGM